MDPKYRSFTIKYANKYPAYVREDMIQEGLVAAWIKRDSSPNQIYSYIRGSMSNYWKCRLQKYNSDSSLFNPNRDGFSLVERLQAPELFTEQDDSIKKVIRFLQRHVDLKTITVNQGNCLLSFIWMYEHYTAAAELLNKTPSSLRKSVLNALSRLREYHKEVC